VPVFEKIQVRRKEKVMRPRQESNTMAWLMKNMREHLPELRVFQINESESSSA
jgi:hypothetical protein